jgi:hypothetical protein
MLDETTEKEFEELLAGMLVVPKLPEFRLYYDDNGKVLFYTCEKPEGNYIVIDTDTYSQGRSDIRVIDGVIHKNSEFAMITKLERSLEGTRCAIEDISIIVPEDYDGKTQTWKTETNEFKYN